MVSVVELVPLQSLTRSCTLYTRTCTCTHRYTITYPPTHTHTHTLLSLSLYLSYMFTCAHSLTQSQGLHLPTGEDDDVQTGPQLESEEKEKLLKEIQELKDEIASMKSGSLLGDQQPKDILRTLVHVEYTYICMSAKNWHKDEKFVVTLVFQR